MRVLLVKMSSLGDVVHTLPGVTDAAAALGADAVSFDWVVEEALAAIPARHPAVAEVIPVAWRRWRRSLGASRGEMRGFLQRLRRERYDLILDAQGLVKSGVVTGLARGRRTAGLSRASAREGAASVFYRRQVAVPWDRHAIDRIRTLFSSALDYACPPGPPDFGIAPRERPGGAGTGRGHCLLLHGTTWESKQWPVRFWQHIARSAEAEGFRVLVPWGDEAERCRASEIAAAAGAEVPDRLPLGKLLEVLTGASLVIGTDSGLAHLAAALGAPTVVLYGSTSSALTGCRGARVRNLQAEFPCSPCRARVCAYRGPVQEWRGVAVEPACYSRLPPEMVWKVAMELEGANRLLHL